MVGRTLHRYRIIEEVGHGGMAVVYRGVDESLERDVAVKLLHPHLAARPDHRRRLAREAKAVARLHHPNILEIYDFSGEDSSEAYLVTELIRGRTLKDFARAHPFDPPELAAACVWVLAGALSHAHEQGIVHRDLKPDNVMIREDGDAPVVKLMDFGIAQIIDRDERMTMTGSLIGSPSHMAPEIIDGEEADARSDLFSLGTILYQLATGQLPFDAPSPGALLKKILDSDYADPRELRPAISDTLAKVIHDALARDRGQRIQTARAFQDRLGEALAEVGIDKPALLLTGFLRTPDESSRALRADVVRHLMQAGRTAAAARRTARALQVWSRVISIAPGTPEAGEARQCIDRLKRRTRGLKAAGLAGAGLLATGLAVGALQLRPPQHPPESPPSQPAPRSGILDGPALPEVSATPTPEAPAPTKPEPAKSRPNKAGVVASTRPPKVEPRPTANAALPPGRLALYVKDVWAHVLVDGERRGQTPYEAETAAGIHRVRLEAECCKALEFETSVAPGERRESRSVLEPLPGRLSVVVHGPPDAGIMVDDQFEAYVSEMKGGPLLVHMRRDNGTDWQYDRAVRLRVFWNGFQDHVQALRVRAGTTQRLEVTLTPRGD